MLRAFPGARLLTSYYLPDQTFSEFRDYDVQPLWRHVPKWVARDNRLAFLKLLNTFPRATVEDVDVVLCSSSGWSHGIQASVPKVVYCHNPARWLYQPNEYFSSKARLLGPAV